jgi:hypothetical protein
MLPKSPGSVTSTVGVPGGFAIVRFLPAEKLKAEASGDVSVEIETSDRPPESPSDRFLNFRRSFGQRDEMRAMSCWLGRRRRPQMLVRLELLIAQP